jgi:dihydrofolate synthase/folylpolyglutamate synthase
MAWTYAEALTYLNQFINYEKRSNTTYSSDAFRVGRVRRLLARLGDPHTRYPSAIIAGTKGKGSTAALLDSMLRAAGLHTGFYSSPHLHTMRERMRLDGAPIPEADLARLVETRLQPVAGPLLAEGDPDEVPTYYELCTALAFLYFAEAGVDFAVLEVGLGGRLDATNVVTPALAVITPISYDHMAILGDTLGQIATEKAGIIKEGRVVLSAPQPEEAATVIAQVAADRHAPLYHPADLLVPGPADGDVILTSTGIPGGRRVDLSVRDAEGAAIQARLPLLGRHQVENAHMAAAGVLLLHRQGPDALRGLSLAALVAAITTGIEQVDWPGRLEIVSRTPLIVVDGAHNGESARRLREALEDDFGVTGREVVYVFGLNQGHNAADIIGELAPLAAHAVLTPIVTSPRSTPPAELAPLWAAHGVSTTPAAQVAAALAQATEIAGRRGARMICATGSLYLVGEARVAFGRSLGSDPV